MSIETNLSENETDSISAGDITMHTKHWLVSVAGKPVDLTYIEAIAQDTHQAFCFTDVDIVIFIYGMMYEQIAAKHWHTYQVFTFFAGNPLIYSGKKYFIPFCAELLID